MLGTWHHGPQAVPSSSSRDSQPEINVGRDSDAEHLLHAQELGWGAGGGLAHSPGQPVSCCGDQGGDPALETLSSLWSCAGTTMEQRVLRVLPEQEQPSLSPCPQQAELALPPQLTQRAARQRQGRERRDPQLRQRHTGAN